MSKWEIKKLEDCFSHIRNGASIKQGITNGGYPITRIETISEASINRDKMGYAGITDISKYRDYIMQSGDILMSHINSETHLGKTALYKRKDNEIIIHGMNLLCLRPINKIIFPDYIIYYFKSLAFKKQIPSITKKSVNQASFTISSLKKLYVPIPPLDEQHKIASILDTVSEALKLRKQQLNELDLLVKSKFVEMFGDIKENPFNYTALTFKDISNVRQGLQIPISKRKIKPTKYTFPYITIQYLNGKKQAEYIENPPSNVICTKNDILMTRTGNTGMVITNVSGVFHNNFFLIDYNRRKLNKSYLIYYLNDFYIQKEIIRLAGTSTIPDLNHGDFYKIKIVIPPIDLQNKFATFVQHVDELKSEVQKSINETQTLFDSLMQRYFE